MDPENPVDLAKVKEVLKSGVSTPTSDVPSNAILTETLASLREKPGQVLPTESLSPTGQAIAKDISTTLKHTEMFVEQKNRDDLLQRVAQHAAEIARLQTSDPGRSLRQKAIQKGLMQPTGVTWRILQDEQLPAKLGRLTRAIVLSQDARQFLFDAIGVGQQALTEVTQTVKEKASSGEKEGKSFSEVVQETGEEVKPVISESKDVLLDRLLALVHKAQSRPEYRDLLAVFEEKAQRVREEVTEEATTVSYATWEASLEPSEQHVLGELKLNAESMFDCIRQLLENLTNASLNNFFDNLQETWQNISNDDQAIESLQAVVDWLGRCTRDTDYVKDLEQVNKDGSHILEGLKENLLAKYRPAVEHLSNQLRYYLDRMRRDPLTQKLTGDISSLTAHLFYDQQGNPTLKPELLGDLQVILPAILRNLRYLRIPDIEIHEPGLDFLATNVVINVGELAPNHLKLIITSDIPEEEGGTARNQIEFEISKIHAEAQNIRFAVDKSGIPPLTDTGLADIRIFDEGMFINLKMQPILGRETATEQTKVKAGLQVMRVECRLEYFDLNVHGSGHDWMYYLLGPYIRRLVREKIEQAVCNFFMTADLMATVPLPSIPSSEASGVAVGSSQTVPEAGAFSQPIEGFETGTGHNPASQPLGPTASSQHYSQSQPQ